MAEEHCQKCGAVLPTDQDEGLCPVCGTPFGAKTTAIDIGGGALEAEMRRRTEAQAASQRLAPNPEPEKAAGPPMGLIIGGALVIAGLILAIVFVVMGK